MKAYNLKDNEIKKADLTNWPLPDNYLIELGRICALWTSLESGLEQAIAKLAGYEIEDYRAFIVFRHTSFPQKLDSFEALCESLLPDYPHLKDYKQVSSQIRTMQTQRNKFIHSSIFFDPGKSQCFIAEGSARGKIKTNVYSIKYESLKKLSMEINLTGLDLHFLITGKRYSPKWTKTVD